MRGLLHLIVYLRHVPMSQGKNGADLCPPQNPDARCSVRAPRSLKVGGEEARAPYRLEGDAGSIPAGELWAGERGVPLPWGAGGRGLVCGAQRTVSHLIRRDRMNSHG